MAYEKQTWVDGETIINAERMNHIEDGIESCENGTVYFPVTDGSSWSVTNLDKLIDEIDSGKMPVGVLYTSGESSVRNYSVGYRLTNAGVPYRTLTVRFYVYFDNAREKVFRSMDLSITRDYGLPDDRPEWIVTDDTLIATV